MLYLGNVTLAKGQRNNYTIEVIKESHCQSAIIDLIDLSIDMRYFCIVCTNNLQNLNFNLR